MRLLSAFCSSVRFIGLTMVSGVLCQSLAADAVAPADSVQHSMFAGSLVRSGDDDGDILRRFDVQLLSTNRTHFFHVIDDARSGCPWPESFGRTGPGVGTDMVRPHLLYSYDDQPYLIELPPLVVELPENIESEMTWDAGEWQMTAIEQQTVNNSAAWMIAARERRGRQQTLTIDAATGVTLRAEAEIFMGMGDQFRLTLARSSVSVLEQTSAAKLPDLQRELSALQTTLKRRPDAHLSELSARQIADVTAASDRLTSLSTATPLEILVRKMMSDTEQQKKRLATSASRAGELINTSGPRFTLSLIGGNGGALESESLKGKIVILHFWDYRDAPLSEPYGQTGYLEFLYNQKKHSNIAVIGVSTNPDLQSAENLNRGRRSVRKLSEFMNLTYPIGYDDGSLLAAFGDPRDDRGQLPLWIVLNTEGKVSHYQTGFYEVDAAHGLKELDAVLARLIDEK